MRARSELAKLTLQTLCGQCALWWSAIKTPSSRLYETIGIPPRFREPFPALTGLGLDGWNAESEGLYIHGGFGTGKTHAAASLLLGQALACPWSAQALRFYSVPALLESIRRTFSPENAADGDPTEEALEAPLIVLDDLAAERPTEWVRERFYLLVDGRYASLKPTIFTSNVHLDQIGAIYGGRLASRIRGCCRIIEITGRDHRMEREPF